jgi:hypothetical protein
LSLTEEGRHQLHSSLIRAIGADAANTLMEMLPPVGWADVATKHDLDQLRAATKHDLDQVHSELQHGLDQLRLETQGDVGRLQAEMHVGFADVRSELHSTLRTNNLTMITANAVMVSLAVALTRLVA